MLHARFYTICKWQYCLIWFRAREYFLTKQRFIKLSPVQHMDQSSMQTWPIYISIYISVSTIISSRYKLAGHCCDCFCDHFGDQEILLVLHFQGNNVLQRTLRGFEICISSIILPISNARCWGFGCWLCQYCQCSHSVLGSFSSRKTKWTYDCGNVKEKLCGQCSLETV